MTTHDGHIGLVVWVAWVGCLLLGLVALTAAGADRAGGADGVSAKRGTSAGGATASLLKAGWYYTWYINPKDGVDAEFVPMIAHGKDANSWYYDRVRKLKEQGKAKCLLAFNEPERKAPGGEISVEGAIRAWPEFEKLGLRLGSPAVAFDNAGREWLDDFMTRAGEKRLRVDFIAVHWYGDVADPNAAAKFMAWLKGVHDQWHKPIWVTEFAGLNWDWLHHPVDTEMNLRFLSEVEPALEKTEWVERYCWFSARPASLFADDEQGKQDKQGKHTRLSRLGEMYRDGGR
jgi:hypothetical protein